MQELEGEKAARISAQKSEAQAIIQFQLARAECDRLQQRVADLEARCGADIMAELAVVSLD